jgi:PAS domain S-box-containing protein
MSAVADAMEEMPQPAPRHSAGAEAGAFFTSRLAGAVDRRVALATIGVSAVVFLACIPLASRPLARVSAFIPAYQAALLVCDLVTAVLIFGQARVARSAALMALGAAYLFCACIAVLHALSFPGLLAPAGVLGGGAQTTAWLYMFWHAGFPLAVIAYGVLKGAAPLRKPRQALGVALGVVAGAALVSAWLATALHAGLPALMQGNGYTPAMIFVVATVWLLSFAALIVLARRTPYTVLQLWVMVVLCAWLFDVGLSAVFNAGRFDLGFYAGRIYGLLAATFVLVVLLTENVALHATLARSLDRHGARLRMLAAIDAAIIAGKSGDDIAASVIQPLRELLDVPRAIVNRFDLATGQVEWVAAAGRRRTHVGPGVRYSIALMGDAAALARGEPQFIDVDALPQGAEAAALLASGVRWYIVVPMVAGGELIGALSFGDDTGQFGPEQVQIAQEVAAQLAIATVQGRLLGRVRAHAAELEEKVRSRTAELEDLYDNAPCGYHSVDANGLITRMNSTWLRWLGFAREEVVSEKRHPDLMTEESARRFREEAFPLFKREGFLKDVEFDYRRKDGSVLRASLTASAIYDPSGRYLGSRSTVFDISERKKAEQALRRSEERVRLIFAGVRDYAILTLDTDGHITSWNTGARLIKGYAAEDIIGRHFSVFYPPEAVQAGWPARELELAAERGHFEDEGWRVRKDGSRLWANVVITAMRDDQGVIRGFSKITRDLSERKRAEEAVKALNSELESFSYSVSHDLRAPLRAINGYAQMLEEDYAAKLDAEGRRLLGVVRGNAHRMGQLIDDLLAFSRLGRQQPVLLPVDMTSLAREVAQELRGARPVAVEIDELPRAQADLALLRQVWVNLIGNAIKYSAKKPDARVLVCGREEGASSVYSVRDNGAGFDMRYAEKLFGVFQRLHRADEFEGTGVGLAIVQRIVARHGGKVWAEGKPGEGACFYFSLPRAAA